MLFLTAIHSLAASRSVVTLVLVCAFLLPQASLVANAEVRPNMAGANVSSDQDRAVQVLSRLTFGARPGDLERVRKMGVDAFIAEQLAPDNIDDTALAKRLEKLTTLNLPTYALAETYNPPKPKPTPTPAVGPSVIGEPSKNMPATVVPAETGPPGSVDQKTIATPTPKPVATPVPKNPSQIVTEIQRAKLLRAVYSERQLYEVVVDLWENHFSIYANKDAARWMLTAFDRDSVRPFALGRFRDLLGATAHSPAMLFYLDNWQSSVVREYPATKDKPARKTGGVNENYARELLELHTMGVDGGYTQKDVQEVARCFTGWTIRKPNEEGSFVYNPAAHDNGEKTVLGVKIPAGGGIADGERVLDILAKHPATARFIATKLARRFLGDDPSPAVVKRAAKVFLNTDGSIAATLRSIVTSSELFGRAAFQTKIKSPFEFVASALRITSAETDANRPVLDWISKMGQPVYGRITPDGYPDSSREWLSHNDLLARFNFASALAMNAIKGTNIDTGKLIASSADPAKAVDEVLRLMLSGKASDKTRISLKVLSEHAEKGAEPSPTVSKWVEKASVPADRMKGLQIQLIALALGAPEFQRK